MKRCPQCEFVYEDDQSLCDMDGILLVFDTQPLPKPSTGANKSQWRSRVVTALAALVLGTVMYLVYYVSTHQQPVSPTYSPAAASSGSEAVPSVTGNEKAVTTPAKPAPKETTVSPVTPVNTPAPEAKVSKEEKAKTNTPPAPKPTKEPIEKPKAKATQKPQPARPIEQDSKISSLLKKTGRVLKKPFKL